MSELKKYDIYAYIESDAAYAHPIIDGIPDTENGKPAEGIEWVKASDAESALAAKDARIKELEALVEKMKCCENCKHIENGSPACFVCDETVAENWEARG